MIIESLKLAVSRTDLVVREIKTLALVYFVVTTRTVHILTMADWRSKEVIAIENVLNRKTFAYFQKFYCNIIFVGQNRRNNKNSGNTVTSH